MNWSVVVIILTHCVVFVCGVVFGIRKGERDARKRWMGWQTTEGS